MIMLLTVKVRWVKICMNWNEQIQHRRDIKWGELRSISSDNDDDN